VLASGQPVFSRAGALVRPLSENVPAIGGGTTKSAQFDVFTADSFMLVVASSATFQRQDGRRRGQRWVEVDPPPSRVHGVLAHKEWPFPRIAGVITTPTLRRDGSLLNATGYDPATELYLISSVALPPIPDKPTKVEALVALALIKDLFGEFLFKSRLDQSVAVAALLTALLRGALPTAPIILVKASTPGVGKSYLVNVISAVVTGRACPAVSAGSSREETEKRIGAILLGGSQIVSLDNLTRDLDDDILCQATEQRTVGIRILGRSEKADCENRTMFFATGNNVGFAGDMVRRGLTCEMETVEERPELRSFRHNAFERAGANRADYIATAFTIIRAHVAATAPQTSAPVGSYEDWSARVRDPLVWLGEPNPVDSMEGSRAEDPVLDSISELFGLWPQWLGLDIAFTTAEIIKKAVAPGADRLRELLIREAESRKPGEISPERVGRWLKRIGGRAVRGCRLERKKDTSTRTTTYKLVSLPAAAPKPKPPPTSTGAGLTPREKIDAARGAGAKLDLWQDGTDFTLDTRFLADAATRDTLFDMIRDNHDEILAELRREAGYAPH
jgi:putative DNA primase/helicase